MAKRRKPRVKSQPLLIDEGPWTRAEFKPPRIHNDRSKTVLVYNGSYGCDMHIGWFDFDHYQWRNNYGMIALVTHWADLPADPSGACHER